MSTNRPANVVGRVTSHLKHDKIIRGPARLKRWKKEDKGV